MFNHVVSASLQNIVETNQVALDVRARVGDRIAHTCLCSQVHNYSKLLLCKELVDEGFVGKVALNKTPIPIECFNLVKTFILDVYK